MRYPPASRSSAPTGHARPNPADPRFDRIVDADAQLKAWNERRLREAGAAPRRSAACCRDRSPSAYIVADGHGSTLELATSAGAIASVVRQHGPANPGGPAARRLAI